VSFGVKSLAMGCAHGIQVLCPYALCRKLIEADGLR